MILFLLLPLPLPQALASSASVGQFPTYRDEEKGRVNPRPDFASDSVEGNGGDVRDYVTKESWHAAVVQKALTQDRFYDRPVASPSVAMWFYLHSGQ